ncbi:MAG: VTT domain-containing protein [Candidatus Babeliales bacterium]|nr:VTT domain-containing protein [Candidatus Babeliales bacterium]
MKNRTKILVLVLIVLAILTLHFMGVGNCINFQNFKEHREYLLEFVNTHYILSIIIFILFYILTVISTLPLAGLTTVVGGFLFGVIPATIYCNIAGVIGATISFLIFRYLLGKQIQHRYAARLENFNKNINTYGATYLLIMHVVAIIPFFIINTLSALTNISLWTFIWTTSIGIIPGSVVYAYAGRKLGSINNFSEIWSLQMLSAFILLGLLGLISLLIQRYQVKKMNKHG